MATGKGYGVARGQISTNTTTTLIAAPDTAMSQGKIQILSLRFMTKTAGTNWRLVVVDGTVEAAGFVVARYGPNTVDLEYTLYASLIDDLPGIPITPGNALSCITSGTAGVVDYEVVYVVR